MKILINFPITAFRYNSKKTVLFQNTSNELPHSYENESSLNGFELLDRIKQMQISTGKELNTYDSSIQIQSLNSRMAEEIMKRQNPQKFYESGWSRQYKKRFGVQETGKFFRQPEQILSQESLYSIPARKHAIDTQFQITKEALDKRQKDNELLYLGTEEQKALQSIVEKQLSKEAGSYIQIAEMWRTMFSTEKGRNNRRNKKLANKIAEGLNLSEEKSLSVAESITGHMSDHSDEAAKIESAAAAKAGLTVENFRNTNEGKKLLADLVHILVTGGLIGAGVMAATAAGVAVSPLLGLASLPLVGFNFKGRVPIGMDGNSIINGIRDGRNLTETIEHTARELDNTLHMTQNLINSSEILARGQNVRYLRGVDQRYANLKQVIDHKQMQFDMSSLGDQSLETKSMYETLGFVVDKQGAIQLNESKKFKNMIFNLGERIFGDHKANKEYKRSLRVLKDDLSKNASLNDVIALNQKKALELDNIIELAESELAEESLKRRNKKNPERLENKRSMLRQLKRFAKTQHYFVNDQKTFYLLKELGNKPNDSIESRKKALYEAAVISFLGSFDSADQVMSRFGGEMPVMHPDGRNFTPNWNVIQSTLEDYYRTTNPKKVLNTMLCSTDFETWLMSVGSFTNTFGSHKTLPSMEHVSCQANAIHQKKACDYKDYNFDSDFVVSPKGTKFYLPIGVPLGLLESGAAQIGIETAVKNSTSGIEAGVVVPQEVLDAIAAANQPKPFMANFWAPTGIPSQYAPNVVGALTGGLASTTIQHRLKPE